MAEEQSLNQMEKKHIEVVRNKLNDSLIFCNLSVYLWFLNDNILI